MTKTRDLSDFLIEGGADLPLGKPHIVPGVLYPGYNDKQIDGTTALAASTTGPAGSTVTSSKYGTVQSDGRMYYYTDIKGSKPIKDPRIGAYFGSQRHVFTSLQLLEQETATYGDDVFSLDGREWLRAVGSAWYMANDATGDYLRLNNSSYEFVEITGYFNDVNMFFHTSSDSPDAIDVFVDGTENATTNISAFKTSVNTPLGQRYVNAGSLHNIGLQSTSLGIHTIKLIMLDTGHTAYCRFSGIELIAQDTTSTANRSKIQIPAQNVVSFGKKFPISATATHYDPFNGFTSGNLAAVQALGIDTDSSLGLNKWLLSGTYYRPFNGARVIKYVDSTGTIKTAVTVMPPNAKSIANSASPTNAFATRTTASHYATNNAMNSFEAGTDLDSDQLSEVAKTFNFREFGNGGANQGSGGTYADASMLSTTDDGAYVMDDGLTSMSFYQGVGGGFGGFDIASDFDLYVTFIGTGFSYTRKTSATASAIHHIVQNLPYGTHVIEFNRDGGTNNMPLKVDGVTVQSNSYSIFHQLSEVHFFQPKKPPIPEDAVVLADYMLMADFVPVSANGGKYISKGVRGQALSRDIFADANASYDAFSGSNISAGHTYGYRLVAGSNANSPTSTRVRLPSFATNFVARAYQFGTRHDLYIDTTIQSGNQTIENSPGSTAAYDTYAYLTSAQNLGVYNFGFNAKDNTALNASALEIATPIHTSSHYQSFETPYLHELVGGDRNMEQHNLVCSPDGKTWDEVTRDTSYIGKSNTSINRTNSTASSSSAIWIFDECRGQIEGKVLHNKDWAIAYDKMICLVGGDYQISWHQHMSNVHCDLLINDSGTGHDHVCRMHSFSYSGNAVNGGQSVVFNFNFERGDTIQLKGGYSHGTQGEDLRYQNFQISRL